MSKYSKIIVGGCSFTDKNYPRRAKPKPLDFKMWPELVGEMYGYEVINTACCGYGNQAIYHKTLQGILSNLGDIEHVYIMWSEFSRQDFLVQNDEDFETLVPQSKDNRYIIGTAQFFKIEIIILIQTFLICILLTVTFKVTEDYSRIWLFSTFILSFISIVI